MEKRKELELFLRRYGSEVAARDHSHTGFGVMAPLKGKTAQAPDLVFGRYGFRPKRDLVLLLAAGEDWVLPECEVLAEGKVLHITAVDDIYYKNRVLYRAAYGYETEESG